MGRIRHHAIIVTSCHEDKLKLAYGEATKIFRVVTPIVGSEFNCYSTFLVPPDGSKEEWTDSAEGDARRDAFVLWLESQVYTDGSSPFEWVELQYGDDNGQNSTLRDSELYYRQK